MAESFVERRRRELGLTSSTPNTATQPYASSTQTIEKPIESDFVTRRKMELGLTKDTRQEDAAKKLSDSYNASPVSHNQFDNLDIRQSPTLQNITKPTSMPVIEAKPLSNEERFKDYPSRKLPIVGHVLKFLDSVSSNKPLIKVGDVGRALYTPGGSGANIAGFTGAVGRKLAEKVPGLAANAAGRATQIALREASAGAPLGAGQVLAQGGDDNEALKGAMYGGIFGGALGGVGGSLGEVISSIKQNKVSAAFDKMFPAYEQAAKNRIDLNLGEIDRGEEGIVNKFNQVEAKKNTPLQLNPSKYEVMNNVAKDRSTLQPNDNPILGRGNVATLGLPESNTPRIVDDIKKQAKDLIKPPVARRDLITYTVLHTGIPREEVVKLTDDDLFKVGQMIRSGTDMEAIHTKLAADQGLNWADLVSGKSVTGNVEAPINRLQFEPNTVKPTPLVGSGGPTTEVVDAGTSKPRKPKVTVVDATVTPKISVKKALLTEAAEKLDPKTKSIDVTPAEVKPKVVVKPRVVKPGTRANYSNQVENGNLSPELQAKINATDQSYEKITNKASDEVAKERVKNMSKAESDFLLNETGGADHIATGYRLQQKLDALGEHDRALVISHKLAKDLTKSGQTSQAASIISRLSPEGQLLNLIRTAEKNGKTVSVADSVEFKAQARKAKAKAGAGVQANQFTEILDRAAKGEQLTPDDVKNMSEYLASAEKNTKVKAAKVADVLPNEFKEPRKRDKIVSYLDDAEQSALARIKSRKNNLNSLPLAEWKDHAIVVSAQIAKGTIKAASHIEDLVKLFGEEIRPVATQVYQKAQSLLKSVSPTLGGDDLTKANQAFRKLSGAAEKEKLAVQEMAAHVKKLMADSKAGNLDPKDVQKLRDYSDEIAEMTADTKPRELPTQDQRFLQSVKALSKKIAQVESEKIPMDQANKEISTLLRQITKLTDGAIPLAEKVDNTHLNNIAHDVMNKTRPNPKPVTLQEKIVEKYVRQQEKNKTPVSPKDISTLRELAKNVTRLSGEDVVSADIAMQKILNSYEKSNAWDKVQAIRYMSMLLNSGTQAVNAVSGPIMATKGAVEDIFGTMVDIALSTAIKGRPRSVTMYGTNPLRFMAQYFKHLIKTGAPAGWHGVSPGGIQNAGEIRGQTFKSNYNPLNWAERTLGAVAKGTDYAAYKTVFDAEIRKSGFLDAINSGVKRSDRQAIKAHVEKFVNEPTEKALLDADRIGKNTTFQRSDSTGGKVANFLASSPAVTKPFVGAVLPFVRTPINMASHAVSMTPAGIFKGLWQLSSKSKASQREAIRTLSLGITGTFGTSAIGYYLSQLGIITGANDSGDKNVDAIKEQAGQGKYRFNQSALKRYLGALLDGEGADAAEAAAKYREGDHAFDYNKFQPIAFPLAIGASLHDNKNKSIAGRVGNAATDAYGSLFGMSTLKGVQDVFQPQYTGTQGEKSIGVASRVAESFFKSFSPSMLAQEARRQDPNVRKTPYNNGLVEDVKGYIMSRTPGLSQKLPASKTTLGLDKLNASGFTGQYINPYKSEIAAYSQAAVIISDLIDRTGDTGLAPSAPDKKVSGKDKKTGEQVEHAIDQDRYEQLQEELGHEIILKIMAMDPRLDDSKKTEKIKDIYTKARKKEMDKVKKELGIKVTK
jgi:hypothetical protein